MIDRTTKALLFAIALGLWTNMATTWLRPTPVAAQFGRNEDVVKVQIVSIDEASSLRWEALPVRIAR